VAGKLKLIVGVIFPGTVKLFIMRKIFLSVILFTLIACGSKTNSETNRSTEQGNSGGSNVIAVDTMRMDTSAQSISPK
jgi:hypothetical protein